MTEMLLADAAAPDVVPRRALVAVTVAILLWTSNFFFVRHADDVLAFTAWRMMFAIPVLAVTAAGTRLRAAPAKNVSSTRPRPAVRLGIVAVGVFFGVSAYVNFEALNRTTLVNVGVIHALQPAIVAVLAARWLGELVDWRLLTLTMLGMSGAILVAVASSGEGTWSLQGDLLAVLGLGMNTLWFLAGRWVRTRTALDATSYMLSVFAAGAVATAALAFAVGDGLGATGATIVYASLTALFGTVGHTLIAWAHRFVPAVMSSLFLLSQPALIAVLAWLAFDEGLRPLHLAGGAVVMTSVALILSPRRAVRRRGMPADPGYVAGWRRARGRRSRPRTPWRTGR
jgi:drug/metabolite transporter (DMT)-like permease